MSAARKSTPSAAPPGHQVKSEFIKANYFRVIHADGAWGGLTPSLHIQMALYSERTAIPHHMTQEVGDESKLITVKTEAKDEIIREVEVDVIMTVPVARALRDWLDEKIGQAEKIREEIEANSKAAL